MNRREWLKILAGGTAAAAGAGTLATTLSLPTRSFDRLSYYAITVDPAHVANLILAATKTNPAAVTISVRRVAPSAPDITVVRNGVVFDPTAAEAPAALDHLARVLRQGKRPATHLVSVEPDLPVHERDPNRIIFEVDGRVVESVDRNAEYQRIDISGTQGITSFSVGNGLRVLSSSCRHKLCMRCGGVRSGRIICAPNRLVATIGNHRTTTFDTITG